MTRALITWGGWAGHEPDLVADVARRMLEEAGVEVAVTDSLAPLDDPEALGQLDLLVPVWTMAELSREAATNVSEAVARGVGLSGCHGGMCDAFRGNPLWQAITGGQWVMHPGGDGVRHRVRILDRDHEMTAGMDDFEVETEQYYLHVDPANRVLAETDFPTVPWYHAANGPVTMPVAWVRAWGHGRVAYSALGHKARVVEAGPPHELLRRALLWAAKGKALAAGQGVEQWQSPGNHW